VHQKNLPTVLQVLEKAADLVSLNVEKETIEQPVKSFHYAGGKHNKGITGRELVLQMLAKGPTSVAEFVAEFKKYEFAPTSYSPVISTLLSAKKVVKLENGKYSLPPGK
jgi:hypothetical protein